MYIYYHESLCILLYGAHALSPVAECPEPGASYPRCYRYFQPKANGKLKCSEDAMELWKTDEGSNFVHHKGWLLSLGLMLNF